MGPFSLVHCRMCKGEGASPQQGEVAMSLGSSLHEGAYTWPTRGAVTLALLLLQPTGIQNWLPDTLAFYTGDTAQKHYQTDRAEARYSATTRPHAAHGHGRPPAPAGLHAPKGSEASSNSNLF